MNFFFKLLLLSFIIPSAYAVQVEALYTSLCDREVGVTLSVDKRFIYFLNTDGVVKKIPRYHILSLASYPLDHFEFKKDVSIPETIPHIRLWTQSRSEMKVLAQGFVLGSNQSGFQFLTLEGSEVFVSNDSIWRIDILHEAKELKTITKTKKDYQFSHPQRGQCKENASEGALIYPSELISDPISIKRKFDSQILALKKLEEYEEAQDFYAVPQLYKNKTSIGYWLPLGNRYGSSTGRVSGVAPLIRNEYSKGPFSFQHLSLTGSGPVPDSTHEESQTMIYYAFKSSYIHFAAFVDPSVILAGKNYQWQEEDLNGLDERAVESSYLMLGFDRGPFGVSLFLHSHLFGAFRGEQIFNRYTADPFRVGVSWKTSRLLLNLNTSVMGEMNIKQTAGSDWNGDLSFLRFSSEYQFSQTFKGELFYFSRKTIANNEASSEVFKGDSQTLGAGAYYNLTRRWLVGTRISLENTKFADRLGANEAQFFKAGLHGSMNF